MPCPAAVMYIRESVVEGEISFQRYREEFGVDFPYCFLQTSNSFHGVVDSWKRLPKKGIPLGPGGNLCVARYLMDLIK